MPRHVFLNAINSELRLATNGITIRIEDDDRKKSGRLKIGKKIRWTPHWGHQPTSIKDWDELIDFMNS